MYYATHDLSMVQYYENVCWWWCGFFLGLGWVGGFIKNDNSTNNFAPCGKNANDC